MDLALTKNIESTMKQGQQTEQKSLRRSSSWLPMRRITESDKAKSEEGTSDLLRWLLMLNSMNLCKLPMWQSAGTFMTKKILFGSEYSKLQRLELVPERWPLARLSFSLQKCVDHLDRGLGWVLLGGPCNTG